MGWSPLWSINIGVPPQWITRLTILIMILNSLLTVGVKSQIRISRSRTFKVKLVWGENYFLYLSEYFLKQPSRISNRSHGPAITFGRTAAGNNYCRDSSRGLCSWREVCGSAMGREIHSRVLTTRTEHQIPTRLPWPYFLPIKSSVKSYSPEIRDQCPCTNVFRICIQECSLIGRHSGMVVGGILVNISGYRDIAGARG